MLIGSVKKKVYFREGLGGKEEVQEGTEVEGKHASIFQKQSSRTAMF
jgi:hypothetical protein